MKIADTVLITGAGGFLGRYAVREFAAQGWRVVGLDDLPPENAPTPPGASYVRMQLPDAAFLDLLRHEQPRAVVHCAGRASVPLSLTDPGADFRGNTVLTFEVLDALRRAAPACRFLLLSSAAVYGEPATLPVAESHHLAPLSPYGFHKRQCELLCEEFARIYGIPAMSLRIFSAYGPGLRRQVVWDMCERLLTTGALRLSGTGEESRDFIHASDVARALVFLASEQGTPGESYNLASGHEITIRALAHLVIQALHLQAEPTFDGVTRAGDPRNWRADTSRLAHLGFTPSVSLEQGVRTVAAWASAELGSSRA